MLNSTSKMSRKRDRNEFFSDESDDNIANSKKKCIDTAKSMDINAKRNKTGSINANNNKMGKKSVS